MRAAGQESPCEGFRNDNHAVRFIRIAGFESAPFHQRQAHRPEEFRIDNPEPCNQGLVRSRRPPYDFEIDDRTDHAERRIIRHGRTHDARQRAQSLQRLIH